MRLYVHMLPESAGLHKSALGTYYLLSRSHLEVLGLELLQEQVVKPFGGLVLSRVMKVGSCAFELVVECELRNKQNLKTFVDHAHLPLVPQLRL